MPVLLLARGDADARELLKKAIEARYGHRPPVIESLRIDFTGRTRAKVGPLTTWVPVEVTTQVKLPSAMRWDFVAKPAGVAVRRGVESYDGSVLRTLRGNGTPHIVEEQRVIDAAQKRLWAIAALLLTPLGDHFVELSLTGENAFAAKNTQLDIAVEVQLKPDYRIDHVNVRAFNVDNNAEQMLSISAVDELTEFGEFLLPKKITAMWGEQPWFEVEPAQAKNNPDIAESVFTLDAEAEAS